MATQPTNLPVPSESPRDLKFNAGKIDEFVTSLYQQYIDRFGKSHYTIEGLKQLVLQQIYNLGWNLNGTFQGGGTVTSAGDLLQDETTNIWYRWDDIQTLPKNVPVGSTPETAGGVGDGKWQPVDVADVLRRDLANPDAGYGDSLIAVLAPFIGAIARTQHEKNADVVSLKDFATGDGVSDEYTAIMAAYNWAASHGKSLFIPAGVYKFSQKLVFSTPGVFVFGAGMNSTSLQFTGAGIAVEFNDSNPNNGAFAFSGGISDLEIVGNANTTYILYNRNVNHWHCCRVNVREASPTTGIGLRIEGPTGCHIQHFVCSTNAQLMTNRPYIGIWMDAISTTGGRTACTTLLHPIIEGMMGDGVVLRGCDQLTWIGGTSENNDGNGVTFSDNGQPRINTLIGVGFESNRGFADIFDAGQMNRFINCTSLDKTYFGSTSLYGEISGGYHQDIFTEGEFTTIHDLKFSFFGSGGTISSRENSRVYNVFNAQTSSVASFPKAGHQLTLGTSPFLFTNTYGFPIDVMMDKDSSATVTAVYFCEGTTPNVKVDASGGIRLDPGNSLRITYSGTPTFYWMPR
ncbi:TPA: hypothetical protein U2Q33_000755 [Citrobacter farmeri]|nr:hypothetical protein [Citrobacter farmeri]